MTHYIGVKEMRQNLDKYTQKVKRGDKVVVLKHNQPQFEMSPVEDPWGDEGKWKSVIDFTKIKKGGVPAEEVLAALRKIEEEDKAKLKSRRG